MPLEKVPNGLVQSPQAGIAPVLDEDQNLKESRELSRMISMDSFF